MKAVLLFSAMSLLQLEEIIQDPVRFAETFLVIRDKRGDLRPFVLNAVQRKLMDERKKITAAGRSARILILKSRRQGVTTLEQAINFWTVAMRRNQQVVTLAHNDQSTEKIFRIANLFYHRMPPMLQPRRLTHSSKKDLNFPSLNSLFYIGTAGGRGFARGDTLNRVHWSEVAWSPGEKEDQRRMLSGLTEACSEGEVVLETTANGIGDLFHEKWIEARSGKSEWTPIFFAWWDDPTNRVTLAKDEYEEIVRTLTDEEKALVRRIGLGAGQIAWRRTQIQEHKELFQQEYPEDADTAFLTSGATFFDVTLVRNLLENVKEPIEVRSGGDIRIFRHAEANRLYSVGCDVAEGTAHGDFSHAGIVDNETEEQVAAIRGKWKPEDFAGRIAKLAEEYNFATVAVERNNHGHSTLNTLLNTLCYPNLYYHMQYDARSDSHGDVLGWPTDPRTRPIMLNDLRAEIESGRMKCHDRIFLAECMTFVADRNGKYQARQGYHDDAVMAWAIALQARKVQAPKVTVF